MRRIDSSCGVYAITGSFAFNLVQSLRIVEFVKFLKMIGWYGVLGLSLIIVNPNTRFSGRSILHTTETTEQEEL